MNLEQKQLDRFIKEETFINIFTDNYDDSYLGFLIDSNDQFLVLKKFDDKGNFDGIIIIFIENITRIRWDGNEISSIFKLIENSKRFSEKNIIDISSMDSVLKSLSEIYGYVNIAIQDIDSSVCFIGEITEMDDETLILNEFGTKVSLDRKMLMISKVNITLIESGGIYEEGLKKLLK
jgi:hypothetical protein